MKFFLSAFSRFIQVETGRVIEEEYAEEEGDSPPQHTSYPMTESAPSAGFRLMNEYGVINPEIK